MTGRSIFTPADSVVVDMSSSSGQGRDATPDPAIEETGPSRSARGCGFLCGELISYTFFTVISGSPEIGGYITVAANCFVGACWFLRYADQKMLEYNAQRYSEYVVAPTDPTGAPPPYEP